MNLKQQLFIGNLAEGITDSDLRNKLSHFGKVDGIRIKTKNDDFQNETKVFAFVDMDFLSEESIPKCINSYNNSLWKGKKITVQIAKSNFLERLEKERKEKVEKTPSKDVKSSFSTAENFEKKKRAFINNSEEEPEEIRGNLRKFTGFKKIKQDHNEFKISTSKSKHSELLCHTNSQSNKTETKVIKHSNKRRVDTSSDSDESAHSDSTDEIIKKTKDPKRNQPASFNNSVKTERHENVSASKPLSSKPDKHSLDNQKRLLSLDERLREGNKQNSIIRSALASLDSRETLNKKIVFDSDSGNSDNEPEKPEKVFDLEKERKNLFSDSDESENEDINFSIRPQFEGKKGAKLAQLQTRFEADERFHLDERFASDEEENEEENIPGEADEKAKSYKILEEVLQKNVSSTSARPPEQKKALFKDLSQRRFDPNLLTSQNLEVKMAEKIPNDKKEKSKRSVTKENNLAETEILPAVSKDRFYKVSSNLKSYFTENENESFSLSKMFSEENGIAETEDLPSHSIESTSASTGNVKSFEKNPFHYDSSDTDEKEEEELPNFDFEALDGPHEEKSFFFFKANDPRIKEGVSFFHRTSTPEEIREKWLKSRPELLEAFRLKKRRSVYMMNQKRQPQRHNKAPRK